MTIRETMQGLVGQPHAVDAILPYVDTYRAGLAPGGRPAGVFLLVGPTGTGKTHTVEVLARALHVNAANVLRVDCGEYQMDHEVSKLIGAPPGYLGHGSTKAKLSSQALVRVASVNCDLSLVLFDEVEKASGALINLLLGILDRGVLSLGDGSTVQWANTMVFMTSNVGARAMVEAGGAGFGFGPASGTSIERLGLGAARKRFPPEFMNRVDQTIAYRLLGEGDLLAILDGMLGEWKRRLVERGVRLDVPGAVRRRMVAAATGPEYGARELKRMLQRQVLHPLAEMIVAGVQGVVVARWRAGRVVLEAVQGATT